MSRTGRWGAAIVGAAAIGSVWLAAQATPAPLDARASDPVAMGWMAGQPIPPERQVRYADGSFYRFPQTRWSFSHIRQLMPTSVVRRGAAPASVLPRAERADLDAVTFVPLGAGAPMTWADSLLANYTDGILVLHRGRIVYERYFGVLAAERQHLAFSVTKSLVATLAATLIAEGVLAEDAAVSRYVPELRASGLGDATLRQLLDMTTAPDYSEEYANAQSSVHAFGRAVGFLPRPAGDAGPESGFDYLRTLAKASAHGERFAYKTVNTEALGAVLRRATGQTLSALLEARLFAPLGPEQDAYFTVDPTGAEFAGGGLNLTLRDLARFGEAIRLGGRFNGRQIVPTRVVDDIRRGGDRQKFAGAGYRMLPGWSYRDMWWVSHNPHGAFAARGVHGQALYIDPKAEMVIARFASHPVAANAALDPTSLPAYQAIAERLMAR